MKALLTSAGITNKTLERAFQDLVGKSFKETKVAFIPTAADVEPGHKDWFVDNINQFFNLGIGSFDVVDIAALERKFWEPRLETADVLYVSGGNEYFLMYHILKSGLIEVLPKLLEQRVWVGVSAGSMVLGKRIAPEYIKLIYEEEILPPFDKVDSFLNFVDFSIKPHMNSPHFPKASQESLDRYAPQILDTFYGLDDNSAIKIVGDNIEVVSEGDWKKYN